MNLNVVEHQILIKRDLFDTHLLSYYQLLIGQHYKNSQHMYQLFLVIGYGFYVFSTFLSHDDRASIFSHYEIVTVLPSFMVYVEFFYPLDCILCIHIFYSQLWKVQFFLLNQELDKYMIYRILRMLSYNFCSIHFQLKIFTIILFYFISSCRPQDDILDLNLDE